MRSHRVFTRKLRRLSFELLEDRTLPSGIGLKVLPPHPTEGAMLQQVKVATFTVPAVTATVSDFAATIYWGTGAADTFPYALIQRDTPGHFSVYGTHTYVEEGANLPFSVYVRDRGGATALAQASINVADAPLSSLKLASVAFSEFEVVRNVVLATFADGNPQAGPSDFTATIRWGDESLPAQLSPGTPGTVVMNRDGTFSVLGGHTFGPASHLAQDLQVTVKDHGGAVITAKKSIVVSDAPLQLASSDTLGPGVFVPEVVKQFSKSQIKVAPTENVPTGLIEVARFIDPDPRANVTNFSATIYWGDGAVSKGSDTLIVANADGTFRVKGNHTYHRPARHLPFSVKIVDKGGATLTTPDTILASSAPNQPAKRVSVEVDVDDAPLTVTINPDLPVAHEGKALTALDRHGKLTTNITLATFTDPDPAAALAHYHATIYWGDIPDGPHPGVGGRPGTIVDNGDGTFSVLGAHTYSEAAQSLTLQVVVQDGDLATGGTTYEANKSIEVLEGVLTITASTPPDQPVEAKPFNQILATFTDDDPDANASDYSVSISWGDGTVTTNRGPGGNGIVIHALPQPGPQKPRTFTIRAPHTYQEEASQILFGLSITEGLRPAGSAITRLNSTFSASRIDVKDADLTEGGVIQNLQPVLHHAFSGAVASFVDPAGDLDQTASIDWGDGTSSVGTVVPIPPEIAALAGLFGIDATKVRDVIGTHTYAHPGANDDGTQPITVTVHDPGGAMLTINGTVAIQPDPFQIAPLLDQQLSRLQAYLDSKVFANPVPLLGHQLQLAKEGQVIDGFRHTLVAQVASLQHFTPDDITQAILDGLGSTPGGLNVLADKNHDGAVDDADIDVTTLGPTAHSFHFRLSMAPSRNSGQFGLDLGLPGLPFSTTDTSAVAVSVGFDLGMTITESIDTTTKVSLSLDSDSTLTVEASVTGSNLPLKLGFLTGTIQDADPNHPSSFNGTYNLHFSGDNLGNSEASATLAGAAEVNLHLGLTFGADPVAFGLSSAFHLHWTFSNNPDDPAFANPSDFTSFGLLNDVSFNDIELDVSSFLGFFDQMVADVQQVTKPLQPLADIILLRLPVLSDVSEQVGNGTLTVASLLGGDTSDLAKFAHFINLVNNLPDQTGDLPLPLGSFSITDPRATGPNQDPPADIADDHPALNLVDYLFQSGIPIFSQLEQTGMLTFPILDDATNLFKLFLQRSSSPPVELFTCNLGIDFQPPSLDVPVPIVPAVTADFTLSVSLSAHATLGYDTSGILTGDPLNGFFADNCSFKFSINGSANVDVGIKFVADVSLGANLSVSIGLDLENASGGQRIDFNDLHSINISPSLSFAGSVDLEADGPFDVCLYKITFGSLVVDADGVHASGPSIGC
jgi:hypothetical protein